MISFRHSGEPPKIRRIFISPSENRMRGGWRVLAHAAVYNILLLCIAIPAYLASFVLEINPENIWFSVIVQTVTITSTVSLARRYFDHKSFSSLGLNWNRQTITDIVGGVIVSIFMMGSIYIIEYSQGWLKFEGFAWQSEPRSFVILSTISMIILFILVGWNEEILFRGYRFQNLREGLPSLIAVLITSGWFGIVHFANPHASWISGIGILLAGTLLTLPVIWTGELWISIGLHIGWNLFEGPVFGFPVSGIRTYTLTRISINGPEIFTGGDFGPEAGLVLIPAILVGLVLTYTFTRIYPRTVRNNSVLQLPDIESQSKPQG